jgi:hypothetical protein
MKRVRFLCLLAVLVLAFMVSCGQQQQIGGVDSSISEMGDIHRIKKSLTPQA